jgi:hypothetical protein
MEQHQVENSSTSNSESGRPWLITVLATLVIVAAVEVGAVATADAEPTALQKLNTQPGDDVFVFGNSMFQTGIDFGPLASSSGRDVVFDYHNGHYTNLWYLIVDQALPLATPPPELIVWGFRPSFAAEPAFRGSAENDNDLFEPGDNAYRRLTVGSDEPIDTWDLAGRLRESVVRSEGLWSRRDDAQAALAARSTDAGVDVVGLLRPEDTAAFRERFANGDVTVTDEILRIATGGEVQLAEELVVDTQGEFTRGPIVPFDESFVPLIAEKLQEVQGEQLVVIWKSVSAVNGGETDLDERFVAEAIAYFETEGIPVLDLYNDRNIDLEMFASGDHYNADGRAYITAKLAETIRSLALE